MGIFSSLSFFGLGISYSFNAASSFSVATSGLAADTELYDFPPSVDPFF